VDLASLDAHTDLGPWSRSRLVPKILLATQTRILEAAIDPRGDWLPAVPVITITPRDPADLWLIAAALLSPIATASALRACAGAGLSSHAIKLSARQALTLSLPADRPLWTTAARCVRLAAGAPAAAARTHLTAAAEATCRAYGLSESQTIAAISWWTRRARW
jgi:hypothetical protein